MTIEKEVKEIDPGFEIEEFVNKNYPLGLSGVPVFKMRKGKEG